MREILFRGKRIEDGEWVYGLPYAKSRYSVIRSTECLDMNDEEVHMHSLHVVIPETVGQYTGLKDKNGKKIFEGFVVSDMWNNLYTPVFQNGIYMAYNPKHLGLKNDPSTQFNIIWKDGCEVIGNIHEEVQE